MKVFLSLGILFVIILSFTSCASSNNLALRRAVEYEKSALLQLHEQNCKGGANPVDRFKRNPEKGNCPLCQF